MTAMIITSILLVVLYVGATIWVKKEIPESISAMVYDLPEGGWRWLWTIWLLLVDVFTFAQVIEILDARGMGYMGFIPMVMIGFVAVWPLFDTQHKRWHNILGIVAGIWSQVDVGLICGLWLWAWLIIPAFLVYCYICERKHKDYSMFEGTLVFISECVCYPTIIGASICH